MNPDSVRERVQEIVARVLQHRLPVHRVPIEWRFHDLCINPIDLFFISVAVEEEWNIMLTNTEIDNWMSMECIAKSVIGMIE